MSAYERGSRRNSWGDGKPRENFQFICFWHIIEMSTKEDWPVSEHLR